MDGAFDRFIRTYVLDLLPDVEIRAVLDEAHRVLKPDGLIGLASLTKGSDSDLRAGIDDVARLASSVAMAPRRLPADWDPAFPLKFRVARRLCEHCCALRHRVRNGRGKTRPDAANFVEPIRRLPPCASVSGSLAGDHRRH